MADILFEHISAHLPLSFIREIAEELGVEIVMKRSSAIYVWKSSSPEIHRFAEVHQLEYYSGFDGL